MRISTMSPLAVLLLVFQLLTLTSRVHGLDAVYCSSQNTGSDFNEQSNNFNSNGACFTACKAQYAFAIVQGRGCWCSNYIPADTTSTDNCNQACPGYPQESCGSTDDNLFGYIALSHAPSGTAGSFGSSPSSSSSVGFNTEVTFVPQTTFQTLSSTSSTSSSSTTSSASSASTTEQSSSSTWSPTPITSLITVTGKVSTVTITPAAPPPVEQQVSSSWSTGKIAGVVVGIVLGVAALAAMIFFACMRIKKGRRGQDAGALYKEEGNSPHRQPSRTSQMSLMGAANRYPYTGKPLPQIQTSGLDGIPYANNMSPEVSSPSSKRASYPRLHDQRLEPNLLFVGQDNGSRVSVRSLQDDLDYSRRVLRTTNPDE